MKTCQKKEDKDVVRRIILRIILGKHVMRMRGELNRLRIVSNGGLW
jgi:hypothetical protein